MRRKLLGRFVYGVYALVIIALGLWGLHAYKVRNLLASNLKSFDYPAVDRETARLLSRVYQERKSSFVNRPEKKPAGVYRIGAFGDSHTFGAEVSDPWDYPALLEAELHNRGCKNIEVLNFGNNYYSFGQSYLLWERVGKRYGLDMILLGPGTFHADRELLFNHTGGMYPAYIHARYVVDGDDVKLIEPIGRTEEEIAYRYYSLIPEWTYLRYERRLPAFLTMFYGYGFAANPFYYFRGLGGDYYETKLIQSRLMRRMAAETPRVALLHPFPRPLETARAAGPQIIAEEMPYYRRLPYFGDTHEGPLGNRLVAEAFIALLSGKKSYESDVLEFSELAKEGADAEAVPVSQVSDIAIEIAGVPTARLTAIKRSFASSYGNARLVPDLAKTGAAGLLALKPPGAPLMQVHYLVTSVRLRPGAAAELRFFRGSRALGSVALGRVAMPAPAAPFGYVESALVTRVEPSRRADYRHVVVASFPQEPDRAELYLGGEKAAEGPVKREVEEGRYSVDGLYSEKGIYLAPDPNNAPDVTTLPPTGVAEVRVTTMDGREIRAPYFRWEKKKYRLEFTNPPTEGTLSCG